MYGAEKVIVQFYFFTPHMDRLFTILHNPMIGKLQIAV
jgi:hypothetical protein